MVDYTRFFAVERLNGGYGVWDKAESKWADRKKYKTKKIARDAATELNKANEQVVAE